MSRVALLALAGGLAGCAQIFGIDNTTAPPDVALPPGATLTLQRVSWGASVEVNPLDLTGLSAVYYVADDVDTSGLRRIPPTAAGNVWTADVPDGVPALVEFTLPGVASKRLFAFPNRDLIVQHGVYEHPAAQPAPMNATLDVTLTLPSGYASGESFALYAIGPWAYHGLSEGLPAVDVGATTIGPATVAYTAATFGSTTDASQPLRSITSADRLVALRYAGNQLTAGGDVAAFDQTGTDTVSATLAAVTSTPLDVTVDGAKIASRLAMPTPAGSTLGMNWVATAAPGYRYNASAGVQLNAGGVPATDGTHITAPIGNPFTGLGWNTLFTFASSRSRTVSPLPLALPITLYTGLNQHFEPAAGAVIDLPAPLPVLALVNGTPLTSDGLTVTLDPNRLVKLSLVADRSPATFYLFDIYELAPNAAGTALDRTLVYTAIGPATEITIPAGVLTTGKTYTIRAHCYRGGFPNIGSGDFSVRDLPLSVGYLDSGVFTVAAP